MKLLSEALKVNNSLKEINIRRKYFYKKEVGLLVEAAFKNNSLNKISLNCDPSILEKINFLLSCNLEWNCSIHNSLFPEFNCSIFVFLLCLNEIHNFLQFKIPKFVLFEIFKKIDRKSFFLLWKNNRKFDKKRKYCSEKGENHFHESID